MQTRLRFLHARIRLTRGPGSGPRLLFDSHCSSVIIGDTYNIDIQSYDIDHGPSAQKILTARARVRNRDRLRKVSANAPDPAGGKFICMHDHNRVNGQLDDVCNKIVRVEFEGCMWQNDS